MKEKLERIVHELHTRECDAVVLYSLENRRYLTGMRTSAGVVIVTASGRAVFAVDFRYITAAKQALENTPMECQLIPAGGEDAWVAQFLGQENLRSAALEESTLSYARVKAFMEQCHVSWTGCSDWMQQLRSVKTPEELEKIAVSQRIAETALRQTMEVIAPGITERQLEAYLTWRLLENGSENGIFGIVMASGPNSALPHAVPTDRKLERGDFLLIDFGALYDGYYSDITRTVAIGQADEEMQKVYQVVLTANKEAIAAAKPGMQGCEVDAVARAVIKEAGYGDYFGHGLGHGVGLEIHEKPLLRQNSQASLQTGNVITVEPGIYLPGRFGVRIEDLLTVTENGCRNFTAMSKELMIL